MIQPTAAVNYPDQFTNYDEDNDNNDVIGERIGLVFRYVTIVAIVVFILLWITRKYKAARILKNTLGAVLVCWGLFILTIYLGNAYMGKQIIGFFWVGFVFAGIGLTLLLLRVPKGARIPTKMNRQIDEKKEPA